jgi:hypothetical protein
MMMHLLSVHAFLNSAANPRPRMTDMMIDPVSVYSNLVRSIYIVCIFIALAVAL